jgi:hypothetical protein
VRGTEEREFNGGRESRDGEGGHGVSRGTGLLLEKRFMLEMDKHFSSSVIQS